MDDLPRIACYTQIVRIGCLIVYFDFDLSPEAQARFDYGKIMLRIGTTDELIDLFYKLKDLADSLQFEISKLTDEIDNPYAEQ